MHSTYEWSTKYLRMSETSGPDTETFPFFEIERLTIGCFFAFFLAFFRSSGLSLFFSVLPFGLGQPGKVNETAVHTWEDY